MAVGPIPWSSIDRYATRYDLSNEEFDVLVHHIRAMENAVYAFEQKRTAGGGK